MDTEGLKLVTIYSDGSCLSNPGPGGWACILEHNGNFKEIFGASINTTNNRMELTGVIEGLKCLKYRCKVIIVTDSQYVVNAFNKGWIQSWKRNNFRDRPNSDLWKILLTLVDKHDVTFQWIKGHAGHEYNEKCDKMARKAAMGVRK